MKKFQNLDRDKKTRILNAAFQEFSEKGFELASTNSIVKKANIGKGMLFYYFKNKKELYNYLIDFCFDITIDEYLLKIDIEQKDVIERFKQAAIIKMAAFAEYPDVYNFMGTVLLKGEEHIPDKLKPKFNRLQELGYSRLYENIDYSLFRDDIEVDKAFQLIQWAIEGYQNKLKQELYGKNFSEINFDPYWEEFFVYLEILKTSFYSKGRDA
ncbi:TetR/AcrR family transcriptional regulator [Halobacillus sp. A1]|uniref:TetR/AcrR family transcriptional regulator n=1 Tax=Halobacillus sp. A1 TaxID=2880262 RepID=UPI0020A6A65A|nr:TetR/AcrR family transcriptional regulator [Halobacillus sp. A1]MCP3033296.1 TetR/AcrR family transcriptional regulator [Halobacillus sp. A1]